MVNLVFRFLFTPFLLATLFTGGGLISIYEWYEQGHWFSLVFLASTIVSIILGAFATYLIYKRFSWIAAIAVLMLMGVPLLRYYHEQAIHKEVGSFIEEQGNLMWVKALVEHSYPLASTTEAKLKRYKVRLQTLSPQRNKTVAEIEHAKNLSKKTELGVSIFLSVLATSPEFKIGDTINCLASVRHINPPASPFDFNFKRYAHGQGVRHQALALSPITLIEATSSSLLQLKAQLYDFRNWIKKRLSLGIDKNSEAYQLMLPLVLGIKNADTQAALEPFKYLGLLHLFAISGLHLGLMLYLVNRLALLTKAPYQLRYAIIFGVLLYYTLITGWAPSIMRTSIFLLIWGLSKVGRLPFRPLNALAATFILSLCINPYQLFQMGFQLSFSIVLALLGMGGLWNKYAKNWARPDAYLPVKFWKNYQRFKFMTGQKVGQTFAVSLFAFVASMGFMTYYFGAAYWWSILLTPFFIPLISGEIIITLLLLVMVPLQNDQLQTKANQIHMWYLQKLHQCAQQLESRLPTASINNPDYFQPGLWFINTGFYDHLICIEKDHLHLFPQSSASLNSLLQLEQKLSLKLLISDTTNPPTIHLAPHQNPRYLEQMPGLISRDRHYLSKNNLSTITPYSASSILGVEIQHLHQPIKVLYLANINQSLELHSSHLDQLKSLAAQAIIVHSSWSKLHPEFITELKNLESTLIVEQSQHGAIQIIAQKEHYQLHCFLSKQTWEL